MKKINPSKLHRVENYQKLKLLMLQVTSQAQMRLVSWFSPPLSIVASEQSSRDWMVVRTNGFETPWWWLWVALQREPGKYLLLCSTLELSNLLK